MRTAVLDGTNTASGAEDAWHDRPARAAWGTLERSQIGANSAMRSAVARASTTNGLGGDSALGMTEPTGGVGQNVPAIDVGLAMVSDGANALVTVYVPKDARYPVMASCASSGAGCTPAYF
jgi:hypothetical protein